MGFPLENEFQEILETIENVSQKITDKEYKDLIDSLVKLRTSTEEAQLYLIAVIELFSNITGEKDD